MLFYVERRVESAQIGARFIGVECEKCGCKYCYQLARIGTGKGIAPYGIGVAAAKVAAEEQSQRDLSRRLAREAELVPCPRCNWINEELVQGYRLGRLRHLGLWALGMGFFGTIGSLIGAWFIAIGPPADRALLPYFLFAAPALFISLGVAMVLARSWWRNRIQPNRDFPLSPQLPPGSPPALVLDEKTGEIQPAKPRIELPGTSSEWLEFQLGRHQFPPVCCECLQSAAKEQAYKRGVAAGVELEIPRCEACARQSSQNWTRIWWGTLAISLLAGGGALWPLSLDAAAYWLLLGAYSLVALAIASHVASTLTAPVQFGAADRSRGIIRLRFRNPRYRALVAP